MNPSLESILLALKPRPAPEGTPFTNDLEDEAQEFALDTKVVKSERVRQLERRAILGRWASRLREYHLSSTLTPTHTTSHDE